MKSNLLILLALLFLVVPTHAWAQTPAAEGLNLTTSPYLINLIAKPDSTASTEIKVHNNGSKSQKLNVGVMKFTASGEQGKPQLMDKQNGDDYFSWISFSETSFSLAPNEWKTIKVTIKVPKSAAFGYYYAVTFTQDGKTFDTSQPSAALSGSSAVLVLLEVPSNNEKRELQLVDFSADKSFYEFLPTTFNIRVKNTGNIHVVPHGSIFVDMGSKRDLGILTVNDTKGNVLPSSNRIFTASWNDGFPEYTDKKENGKVVSDSKGVIQKTLKWDFNNITHLRFGHYTAHLLLVYDNGTRDIPLQGTVSFWVVPVRVIIGGLFVTLLVLIGLQSTLRNIWRKIFRRS